MLFVPEKIHIIFKTLLTNTQQFLIILKAVGLFANLWRRKYTDKIYIQSKNL